MNNDVYGLICSHMQELFKRKETLEKGVNLTLSQRRHVEVLILFTQHIV